MDNTDHDKVEGLGVVGQMHPFLNDPQFCAAVISLLVFKLKGKDQLVEIPIKDFIEELPKLGLIMRFTEEHTFEFTAIDAVQVPNHQVQ